MNIPTVSEYKVALATVLNKSTAGHQKMLRAHYRAENYKITATELANAAGYIGYRAANLQYGQFSKKICELLSFSPQIGNSGSPTPTYVLAEASKPHNSDWEWRLRPEVIQAIKELKLFDSDNELINLKRKNKVSSQDSLSDIDFNNNLLNQVAEALKLSKRTRELKLSIADKKPSKIKIYRLEFQRNPLVIAEVLSRADGHCEHCGHHAPFNRLSNGTPYLEVHHVIPLSQGGEDTIENAMALCPNCHRKMHYGE